MRRSGKCTEAQHAFRSLCTGAESCSRLLADVHADKAFVAEKESAIEAE
jgi:hypothetical protein